MSSAREQFFADNGYSPFADTSDSWNQHRESVQKRFDDFQREADQDRKMMFDNFPTSRLLNGHGMERPFMGSPVSDLSSSFSRSCVASVVICRNKRQ